MPSYRLRLFILVPKLLPHICPAALEERLPRKKPIDSALNPPYSCGEYAEVRNREGNAVKTLMLIALALVILVSVAGCRNYGYRPYYAGGPHLDWMPEPTFPLFFVHKPVPYEELKEVYPPEFAAPAK